MELIKEYTQNKQVGKNIEIYCKNNFIENASLKYCTDNQWGEENPSVSTWSAYGSEGKRIGLFNLLRSKIVQFKFPIDRNISKTEEYKNATSKGIISNNVKDCIELKSPENLELQIHNTFVGKIPVLIIPEKDDFNTIVRAMLHRNEPHEIPSSMGAVMITGFNNWDRIHRYRDDYLKNNPFGNWGHEFTFNLAPNKELYQDRLILLSKISYSNVSHSDLGLEKQTWINYSLKIRLEHECTHFFTKVHFGCMHNNIYDELIADYMGISKVLGRFNSKWFLKFLGLEDYPIYRQGGRLENYIPEEWMYSEEFEIISKVTYEASLCLHNFDKTLGRHKSSSDRKARLLSICSIDLLTMASAQGLDKLLDSYQVNTNSI